MVCFIAETSSPGIEITVKPILCCKMLKGFTAFPERSL